MRSVRLATPEESRDVKDIALGLRLLETWRLVTCHWTHWNLFHVAWDVILFGVLAREIEREGRRRLLWLTLAAIVAVSAAVWIISPHLTYYRGLSGITSAYLGYWGVRRMEDCGAERWIGAAVLAGLAAKVAFELMGGTVLILGDAAGFGPAPMAHAAGGLVGVVAGMASRIRLSRCTLPVVAARVVVERRP